MSDWAMVDTNLQMAVGIVLALALTGCLMKLVALLLEPAHNGARWFFLLSPLVSPTSLRRCKPVPSFGALFLRTLATVGALLLFYFSWWQLLARFEMPSLLRSYVGIAGVYLWGETLGSTAGLLWSRSGRLLPGVLNQPLFAKGIADFWGNRWNVWFSDWFRLALFQPLHRRPIVALFAVFGFSGLMHEWVINFPLYIVTGKKLFGSMLAYFLLQAVAVLLERGLPKNRVGARVWLVWLVVIVPAPLVINEGLLRALQLWF